MCSRIKHLIKYQSIESDSEATPSYGISIKTRPMRRAPSTLNKYEFFTVYICFIHKTLTLSMNAFDGGRIALERKNS